MFSSSDIIALAIAIVGSGGLWTFIQHLVDIKKAKGDNQIQELKELMITNDDKLNKKLDETDKKVDELAKSLEDTKELGLSTARDRVNFLCNKYISQGYIPQEDYDSFIALGASYVKNGNTSVKSKFEYCEKNLEVKGGVK